MRRLGRLLSSCAPSPCTLFSTPQFTAALLTRRCRTCCLPKAPTTSEPECIDALTLYEQYVQELQALHHTVAGLHGTDKFSPEAAGCATTRLSPAGLIEQLFRTGRRRRSAAVGVVARALAVDHARSEQSNAGDHQTPALLQALRKSSIEPGALVWLYSRRMWDRAMASCSISSLAVVELFTGLYALRQHARIFELAQALTRELISADTVRIALASVCKLQRKSLAGTHKYAADYPAANASATVSRNSPHPPGRHCRPDRFMSRFRSSNCPYSRLARRLVDLLAARDPGMLTAAHLSKLLEIELASVPIPAYASPPRQLGPWFSEFSKYRVPVSVHAFTILIYFYLRHGDAEYAQWIFQRMEQGTVPSAMPSGAMESVPIPSPNSVTLATIALLWCQNRDWERVGQVLARLGGPGAAGALPRLVTRIVSAMVDCGDVAKAEKIWLEYGHTNSSTGSNGERPAVVLNERALAKLVLGCTRTGQVAKAIGYFRTACEYSAQASRPTSYLTGLLNAVLRCTLDEQPSVPDLLLCHHESEKWQNTTGSTRRGWVMHVAQTHGVRFDIDTYNVLISQLSRLAYKCALQEMGDVTLDRVAQTMHGLYLRLCKEGLAPDDMMLSHLVPMWCHLGMDELATEYWRLRMGCRKQHTREQVKRHTMHRAARWNIEAVRVLKIIE